MPNLDGILLHDRPGFAPVLLLTALPAFLPPVSCAEPNQPVRPNIVLLLADDK
jgi:hypothetical protein